MSVVSLVPLVNWTVWVFVAWEEEDSNLRAIYYAFAILYALPLFHDGLTLDRFWVASVLACALHVQLERMSRGRAVFAEEHILEDKKRKNKLIDKVSRTQLQDFDKRLEQNEMDKEDDFN
ncbi:hypothetical protein WJX72_008783 [[Myrmecia] bisecta]|uniref:Uncharacterized protein n=1 Tax=[Myrmecia] bisecta TaxID=41462 RepID=A0AAW1PAJ9_9CHLO